MKLFCTDKKGLLLAMVVCLMALSSWSQPAMPAALNSTVGNFTVRNENAAACLDLLAKKTGIRFSYKTDILPLRKMYSLDEEKKTIGQLLYLLFRDDYEYEEQSGYIIIQPRHSYFILSGIVKDAASGRVIEGARVSTLADAFGVETDMGGYFELKIPSDHKVDYIAARKDFYSDGFMEVRASSDRQLLFSLQAMKTVELETVTTSNVPVTKDSKVALGALGTRRRGTTRLAVGGLFNYNIGNARNLQLSGVVNIIRGSLYGVQLAGLHNMVRDTMLGVQVSGLINRSEGLVKGVQIAAVNRTKKLKGLQIGLINIADTSDGYSLGLLNLVKGKDGYRRLSLYATDLTNANLSLKLGNSKLYSVLMAGANFSGNNRLYTAGLGLGHDFILNEKLSVSTEVNYQFADAGSWDNRLFQASASLNVQVFKSMLLFAGPVYHHYTDNQGYKEQGYKNVIPYTGTALFERGSKSWIGWQFGITALDLPVTANGRSLKRNPGRWSLQAGISPGIDLNGSAWFAADIFAQREFREGITARAGIAMNNSKGNYALDPQYNFRVGMKVMLPGGFYVGGDIGYGQNRVTSIDQSPFPIVKTSIKFRFLWSPTFGWKLNERFDLSARYENLYNLSFLRLGYSLWYSKK
ncbi:MAG: hypothetical protein DI535_09495 [Citrobacter freundii]|nr:MAG: hypothetical protein DI535_09495 [Citrobacter freundii]